VKEMIKTAIENKQNLIVEGCYVPFDWQKDFSESYLQEIKFLCLVMTGEYIKNNFTDILKFENIIEKRIAPDVNKAELIAENKQNLRLCKERGLDYILIDKNYETDLLVKAIGL
ncbi:MAG: adenylate kinase, partial [Clostridia bacterium]|nr:adenylate kinase [Clostridia bacterium]